MLKKVVLTALALAMHPADQALAQSAESKPAPGKQPAPTTDAGNVEPSLDPEWVREFQWRSIGPANMGGRIVDLAVYEPDPDIFYVATASGGLLKTTNNGTTFEHGFDRESSVSIGAVAVSRSDPDLVWVGTGEENPRNSVSWGDGVYRSADGGRTWEHMGLKESFQTGAILIHPQDNDTVFVGALGRLWGPNEERGVFRTTDAGKTWEKVLFVDENTGCIDLSFQPGNPDVMLAAMWERRRDEFDTNDPATRWGPGSGLYRSEDGGDTWTRIEDGLPTVGMGRMGMDWSRTVPDTVYLLVDTERIGEGIANPGYVGITGRDADAGARITTVADDSPATEAGVSVGDIIIAVDGKRVLSYDDLLAEIRIREAGTEAVFEALREGEVLEITITLAEHPDPDRKPFSRDLGGQRDSIQDQQGEDGFQTGGLFRSTDAGRTWERINSINPRPIYFSKIRVDPSDDNFMWILGIPLSRSEDNGKTWSRDGAPPIVHVDHHAMWIDPDDGEHLILGNDGGLYVTYDRGRHWEHLHHMAIGQFYHVNVDDRPLYNVYGGLQDNGTWGGPNRTRYSDGPYNTDWFRVGGGDGFLTMIDDDDPDQVYYSSQNGGLARVNFRTGERRGLRPRPPKDLDYRWNWRTPFLLSHHNADIYYCAGNYVFRSYNEGDDLKRISPEITRTRRGSATALDESPLDPDLIMVGSDDGSLWVSRDGGNEWENILYPYDETAYPEAKDEEDSDEGPDEPDRTPEPQHAERAEEGAPPSRVDRMLRRLDANGDGRLQKSEVPPRMRDFFEGMDTDGDGALHRREMQAAAAQFRQRGPRPAPERAQPDPQAPRRPEEKAMTSPVAGVWQGRFPGDAQDTQFTLTISHVDAETLRCIVESPVYQARTDRGVYVPELGQVLIAFRNAAGSVDIDGRLTGDGSRMEGTVRVLEQGIERRFEAERIADPPVPSGAPRAQQPPRPPQEPSESAQERERPPMNPDDPIVGEWQGRLAGQAAAGPPFSITITRIDDEHLRIEFDGSTLRETADNVPYNPEAPTLAFSMTGQMGRVEFTATLSEDGKTLSGTVNVPEAGFGAEWEATRLVGERETEPAGPPLSGLVPGPRRVSSIEWSKFARDRVYVTLDGHYYDDDQPHVYMSEDAGRSWRSLRANLPEGTTRVIREDLENENLLYLGTEFFLWVSIDRGRSWTRLNANLPTVAIHEIAQHETSGEIIAATHGRSLWALDVTPLRRMTPEAISAPVHLYKPNDVIRWNVGGSRGRGAHQWFAGQNPDSSAQIYYSLAEPAPDIELEIRDIAGKTIRELAIPDDGAEPGLHRVEWDLREDPPPARARQRFRRGRLVPPATYRVVLTVADVTLGRNIEIHADPAHPDVDFAQDEFLTELAVGDEEPEERNEEETTPAGSRDQR